MKTLLINPPMYDQRKYGKPFILPYGPPLGIAYLESTLDKHGFVVKAIDMFDYSWDKVKQTLAGRYYRPWRRRGDNKRTDDMSGEETGYWGCPRHSL